MRDIAETAVALRTAKRACRQFLSLWAMDSLDDRRGGGDREGADRSEREGADYLPPGEHAWAAMYEANAFEAETLAGR